MLKDDTFVSNGNQSDKVYATSISIPSSAGITLEEMKTVVNKIKLFYSNN